MLIIGIIIMIAKVCSFRSEILLHAVLLTCVACLGFDSVKINTDINSVDIQITIMQAQQYHFVPLGSFFQYSSESWEMGFDSSFLSKITLSYTIKLESTNPVYNFIVLNSNQTNAASSFNCYARAVNQGVSQLMDSCNFSYLNNSQGTCSSQITQAAMTMFSSQTMFVNCSDLFLAYNISLDTDIADTLNQTLLFIIDNSGLFPEASRPQNLINLILSYSVIAQVNESGKAKLFLFCGLTGILIIIMVVFAAALHCKINRIDKQIKQAKEAKSQ